MAIEPPFKVSPIAEKFLKTLAARPGLDMGLVLAYGFESREPDDQFADRYDGVHFYVGWNEPPKWSGERVSIAGLDLWVSSEVAHALRGKTLTIAQRKSTSEVVEHELLVAI